MATRRTRKTQDESDAAPGTASTDPAGEEAQARPTRLSGERATCRACGGWIRRQQAWPRDVWLHERFLKDGTPSNHAARPLRSRNA